MPENVNQFLQDIRRVAASASPASDRVDIVYGVVKSTSPLEINVENRLTLGASFFILSPFCKELTITGSDIEWGPNGDPAIIQKITLWHSISAGDKVALLRVRDGKAYYVLHKEE